MSTPNPGDPFAAWREMVAQWEKNMNALGNQAMASDQFGQSMSQFSNLSLGMQQMMGEMLNRMQAAANLPTRADIAAINERLRAIEETLSRLAAVVDRLEPAYGAGVRPARTRKPPAAQE